MSTWRVEGRKMKRLGRLHYTEYAIVCDEMKLSSDPSRLTPTRSARRRFEMTTDNRTRFVIEKNRSDPFRENP